MSTIDKIRLQELQYLEKFAIHEWDQEYIRKGMVRTAFLFKKIVEHVSLDNKKVLDLGCGMGNVSILTSKKSCVVALDISIEAVKQTKWRIGLREIKNVFLVTGDALKLPFIDETFDVVIAYDLYEHLENQEVFIKEVLRVTNKKGFLVITTGNQLFPFDRHTQLWFIDYLPKKLANHYARLMGRRNLYRVFQPTYWSLLKQFRTYFKHVIVDGNSVLRMIENVYSTHFRRHKRILVALEALAKIGVFKFVTPKFILLAQK